MGRSWQAITAGYVALFAIVFWILGPVALLLGIAALRTDDHRQAGRGRAWFAIIVGSLSTLLLLAALAPWLINR